MANFKKYTVMQDLNSKASWINFIDPNSKNEKMLLCLSYWNNGFKRGFPYNKYIDCRCYVEQSDGLNVEKYNPQITVISTRRQIVREWELEDTEENCQKLIDEVARRFYETN